eukprot:TRINITY_DN6559_c0_g1_i1.p1 TRINITY_DN6559_c0_g1~~TRINITY_DN6559_c0_g1_i1.p1  ORF type:complete len:697 (+),score=190.58 TRINITY_DN6559_c0_g1_i1:87-2177(+)
MEGLELTAARMKELAEDLSFRAGARPLPPPQPARRERSTTPSQASAGAHPAAPPGSDDRVTEDPAVARKIQQVVLYYQSTIQDFTQLLDSNQKVIEELRGNYARLQQEHAAVKQQQQRGGSPAAGAHPPHPAHPNAAAAAAGRNPDASMQELSTQLQEEKRSRLYTEEQSISIVAKQEEIINRLEAKLRSAEEQNQRLEETVRQYEGGARPARAPGTPRNSRITFSAPNSASKGTNASAVDISHLSSQLTAPPAAASAGGATPGLGERVPSVGSAQSFQPASTLNTLASNTFHYGQHRSHSGPAGGGGGSPPREAAAPPAARSASVASERSAHHMFNYNSTVPVGRGAETQPPPPDAFGGGAVRGPSPADAQYPPQPDGYGGPVGVRGAPAPAERPLRPQPGGYGAPEAAPPQRPHPDAYGGPVGAHATPGREGARLVKRASPTRGYAPHAHAQQQHHHHQQQHHAQQHHHHHHQQHHPQQHQQQHPHHQHQHQQQQQQQHYPHPHHQRQHSQPQRSSSSPPRSALAAPRGDSPERAHHHPTTFSQETGFVGRGGGGPPPAEQPVRHTLRAYNAASTTPGGRTPTSNGGMIRGHKGGGSGYDPPPMQTQKPMEAASRPAPGPPRGGGGGKSAGDDIVSSFLRDMNQELKSLNESEASRAAVLHNVFPSQQQQPHYPSRPAAAGARYQAPPSDGYHR